MTSNFEFRIPSFIEAELQNVDDSINTFKNDLLVTGLNYNQTNKMVDLVTDLIAQNKQSILSLFEKTSTKPEKIVNDIMGRIEHELQKLNSQYKRLKEMKNSMKFVDPVERSSGFKIKPVFDEIAACHIPKAIQTTFQFIPITKTLTALFSEAEFEKTFIDFNHKKDHVCNSDVYVNFCCGSVYKSSEFFKTNPNAIQIRLFTDDFEPCDPLKSKVGVHKVTAFYFQINNFPPNLLAKTDNIYLVALSDSSDSKSEFTDVHNVIETIIEDLKILQTKGILTKNKNRLKGALVCVSFDNLGGNSLFGFSEGFNANYFCRICTSKRDDCQRMVNENPSTIRTKADYDVVISKLDSRREPNLTATKGVKSWCPLNNLDNFHILSNISVDLMHDVFEGSVGFLIEEIFNYCVTKKIASIDELQSLAQYNLYGSLSKSNIPSKVIVDKKNVGQNASQAKCLIFNLPFILHKFKTQLEPIWPAVESMLQIVQILISEEIGEVDLKKLSDSITTHLQCYQLFFNKSLKPKHHFLLHYVRVIRAMGPVVRFWAMRMEAKHQYFKHIVHKTKNFINIKKTMAIKHQEMIFATQPTLINTVERGKCFLFVECSDFEKYYTQLKILNMTDEKIENSFVMNKLRINDRLYKPGFLVASKTTFFEIQYILSCEDNFLFLCDKFYDIIRYDSFLNSFEIDSKKEITVINLQDLKHGKPYEKKYVEGSIFVIVDCLTTSHMKNH